METGTPTQLSFVADQANTFALATTANSATVGQWCHAYANENSVTDRTVVLNGNWASRGTNSTSKTPGSLAQTVLGAFIQNGGTATSTWNGLLSQVCIGRGQLTPTEVFALSRGASPWDIRPNNILLWLPLGLGATIELDPTNRFRTPLANTGATFSAKEPPLLLPQKSRRFQLANSVSAAFKARYYYDMTRAA